MAESAGTIGDVLTSRRIGRFVGRAAEIELFAQALDADEPPFCVLYIHGPGGIGKTSLVDVLANTAAESRARIVRIDAREISPTREAVWDAFSDVESAVAPGEPSVVLLDNYERLAELDDWVRETLTPGLPATTIMVIAGRIAPGDGWRADPAWRELLRVVSLRNLSPDESREYLRACGVPAAAHARLIEVSYGHPLGLSLLADVVLRGGENPEPVVMPPNIVATLVRQFVDVVPDDRQRRALQVCAIARVTTEALLRDALETEDVHELFEWLTGLSFVATAPDGIYPHELARDVLDVDLRWRDPEGYKRTFRRVRAHTHRKLRATRGSAQQLAIFDEKFVFRNLPSVLSPVDWKNWGVHLPEPAEADDRDEILDLVQLWEGAESAALARRWFDTQPGGFSVLRRQDGSVGGFVGLIDLTAAAAAEREADPVARSAWRHARQHAPPRAGEPVLLTRYIIDRDVYQAPSPSMNATPVLTIQRYLSTPNLAWDYLALAEPDAFDDYFAAADLARVQSADAVVGQRRFGLFAHDFRKVPVDAWLELVTERALEQDLSKPPDHPPESVVLSAAGFEDAVRQALRDLRAPDRLARNVLLRTRLLRLRAGDGEPDAVDLEGVLSDAIDKLRDDPRDDKLFRAVERTYVRPATTQEAAAESLGVPFSSYRRHLTKGVDKVVAWMWQRELSGADR